MNQIEFLDLGHQPLSNKFISQSEKNTFEDEVSIEYSFPLKVQFNTENYLISLVEQPNAKLMFKEDYPYHTGGSQTMRTHFKNIADSIKELYEPEKILEIGSNDGTFLKHFLTNQAVSIEPCKNFCDQLNNDGYRCYPFFWNIQNAKIVKEECGQFDLIYAANCACHVPDIDEFFEACFIALKDGGALITEDPSLSHMIKNCAFSQFYDEHHYLFSGIALEKIAYNHGLRLVSIDELPNIHMGSQRYIFEKGDYDVPYDDEMNGLLGYEEGILHLDDVETYFKFAEQVRGNIEKFYEFLLDNVRKRVIAFGATSKANTIYSYLDQIVVGYSHDGDNIQNTCDLITQITDTTPEKIGKFTPLTHIPIIKEPENLNEITDIIYLAAPNYQKEILKKHENFKGTWITTQPYVHEVKNEIT